MKAFKAEGMFWPSQPGQRNQWALLMFDDELGMWVGSSEGPWDTKVDALDFAETEVGLPWLVVPVPSDYDALEVGGVFDELR